MRLGSGDVGSLTGGVGSGRDTCCGREGGGLTPLQLEARFFFFTSLVEVSVGKDLGGSEEVEEVFAFL